MKKKIVISATNLIEGGGLSILKQSIDSIKNNNFDKNIKFIFVVNSILRDEIFCDNLIFNYYDYPKKNWFFKLFFEYIHSYFISIKIKPYAWLSLHDISPNVLAKKKYVYCHNPSIFYKSTYFDFKFDKKFFLFTKFYKYLYMINLKKNNLIFVQQNWIKKKFIEMFKINNIKVFSPGVINMTLKNERKNYNFNNETIKVFYPSLPRVYKNFHFLLFAIKKYKLSKYEFIFTIDGHENKYSKYLRKNSNYLDNVRFVGHLNLQDCYSLYQNIDIVVFPSKLETWGLPLSEAQYFNKKIVAPRLDYVLENCSNYPNLYLYEPDKLESFVKILDKANNSIIVKTNFSNNVNSNDNWKSIFNEIIQ